MLGYEDMIHHTQHGKIQLIAIMPFKILKTWNPYRAIGALMDIQLFMIEASIRVKLEIQKKLARSLWRRLSPGKEMSFKSSNSHSHPAISKCKISTLLESGHQHREGCDELTRVPTCCKLSLSCTWKSPNIVQCQNENTGGIYVIVYGSWCSIDKGFQIAILITMHDCFHNELPVDNNYLQVSGPSHVLNRKPQVVPRMLQTNGCRTDNQERLPRMCETTSRFDSRWHRAIHCLTNKNCDFGGGKRRCSDPLGTACFFGTAAIFFLTHAALIITIVAVIALESCHGYTKDWLRKGQEQQNKTAQTSKTTPSHKHNQAPKLSKTDHGEKWNKLWLSRYICN